MDVAHLEKEQLLDLVAQQSERIALLEQELRLLKIRRYGRQSESVPPEQYTLFDTPEPVNTEPDDDQVVEVSYKRKKRGKRAPCNKNLERHRVEHELPADHRHCACGGELKKIDEIITQQYEIIPARYIVIEHVQHKYACPCCKQNIQLAPKPPQPIAKANAGAGLLAQVATHKYVDGVPLHRQEAQHARGGIHLPRNTMARWLIALAELIVPLINLFEDAIRAGPYIQCDETRTQVLKEMGRKAATHSQMWVRRGGAKGADVVIFNYYVSRSSEVALELFEDYVGYVQCDGYSAYQCLEKQGIVLVGCMAHARRKFHEAFKGLSNQETVQKSKAMAALKYITRLYAIETQIKDQSPEQRHQVRQQLAVPILNEFRQWLESQNVLPKSLLGKATSYCLNQWPKLIRYCDDGLLEIDNNRDEQAIRPFAIGRKNFLFSDTPEGAHANARFYSLIETCKLHGHEPYAYLKHIFKELPRATSIQDCERLLPWNLDVESVRQKSREI
jgi:transposase